MKINLKELSKEKAALDTIESMLLEIPHARPLVSKLRKVTRRQEEIERDLEMCGESILELDKPRLEAIQERNKALGRREEDV